MQAQDAVTSDATLQKLIPSIEKELALGKQISIIRLTELLLTEAHTRGASDIHIDPSPTHVLVRVRVDGILIEVAKLPLTIHQEVISRIKVLAGLRTDEHQSAQDGRFQQSIDGCPSIDMRVSIMPTYYGENAVLRLLTDRAKDYSLEKLGFNQRDQEKIKKALHASSGMVLCTGPTGSGKTTTLYSMIKMLNAPQISIITIEDPIEYSIDGVEQIQVNSRTGLTFANGLRSILRQDPDILMVGEIRDAETASIAVNTALTGHLLLSTLHTSDSASTLPRLVDMGIDAYLVASTIKVAIGQRLVRTICTACKLNRATTESLIESIPRGTTAPRLSITEVVAIGEGCEKCHGTGYRGRVCINEVLVADSDIRSAILRRAPADELKRIAIENGMTTMLDDGIEKVRSHITTIEEILRVTYE